MTKITNMNCKKSGDFKTWEDLSTKLSISATSLAFLRKMYPAPKDAIHDCRHLAYEYGIEDIKGKSRLELTKKLHEAGYIRDDLDRLTFSFYGLFKAIYSDYSKPTSVADMSNRLYEVFICLPEERIDLLRAIIKDALPAASYKCIAGIYGLEDGHQRTLEQVSREIGYTRERIRQVEAKAIRRLRDRSVLVPYLSYVSF